ncbi:MAG: fumarate hydratase [Desulfovibrionaceae bacterium]
MKEISLEEIQNTIVRLAKESNFILPADVVTVFEKAKKTEESPLGKQILEQILDNVNLADKTQSPMCQDTGIVSVFLDIGREVILTGNLSLEDAVNEAIAKAYSEAFLRKSIVSDPLFDRINTKTNTPVVLHSRIVEGDTIHIIVAPKGSGSENKGRTAMLVPSEGILGVKKFVLETILMAGASACPPFIVGIGIGGTLEMSALLAKRVLFKKITESNQNEKYAAFENELLEIINKTGLGPVGLGGTTTAVKVHIDWHPCHIASLPITVFVNCHAARHAEATL